MGLDSEKEKYSDHARWLFFVAFYAILANIPYWTASRFLGLLPLGWFCVEYAGVGLLALFLPRIIAAALLLLLIAADLTAGVSKTYFLSPTECVANVGSLLELPHTRFLGVAVVVLLTLLAAAIAACFPMKAIRGYCRRWAAACLVAFAVTAVSADYLAIVRETGHLPNPLRFQRPSDANKFSRFDNLWISRYPIVRLINDQIMMEFRDSAKVSQDYVPSAAALAVHSPGMLSGNREIQEPNLVLVLVESWGSSLDATIRNSLTGPYGGADLLARYNVLQGAVPFYGNTVSGEARELCGTRIGSHIIESSAQALQKCLPSQLMAQGYHTISAHGMTGTMFRRSNWYTTIGFQEQWFKDQFQQQGLPNCTGAFIGTCDSAVAGWIGTRLERKDAGPDFVYWVTLNSHLPVPIPAELTSAKSCSLAPMLVQQSTLCSWYQLVYNVHQSVSELALAPLARPTVFVIVGDHPPPFANPTLRDQFVSQTVPYVILLPR